MDSCYERLLKSEEPGLQQPRALEPEQVVPIQKAAPCLRERYIRCMTRY
jgi:hypothetical protein